MHLSVGPVLKWNETKTEDEIWAFVQSWGGEWLWDHIYTPLGIDAMVNSTASGTTIHITGGSYSRKIRSDIDGAGSWMIYCKI